MYSWKYIRIACFILLLLPIVHVAYLMSRATMEMLNADPDTWAREVAAYAAADARTTLPQQPIVVVGGQRVRLWRDLTDHLAPWPVLMRGLGDAIIEDITFNYARLIGFYRPDTVVLLPGNSEFFLRDNKTSTDLAAAIEELLALDASFGLTRRFYIFTPLKTPLRTEDHQTIDEVTNLLRSRIPKDARVVILDANPLLADADSIPSARYFRGDGINLNEHGYLRLAVLLRTQIEADIPPAAQSSASR